MQNDSVRPSLVSRRRPARLAASVCASAAAVAIATTLAWAAVHTRLESSVPAADEVLTVAPELFELTFSGPVNEGLSELVLLVPSGDSVHIALRAPGDDARILVGEVPDLADGLYVVRWRTVSADGHPVSGEFRFTFRGSPVAGVVDEEVEPRGAPEAEAPEAAASEAAAPGDSTPPAGGTLLAGFGLICLLGFSGLLWYCGSLALLREPRIARAVLVLGSAALIILGADLVMWLRAVVPSGSGFAGVGAAIGSGTGVVGLARLALIGSALALLRRHGRAAAGLALTALLIGAASGHAAAVSPWLTVPANAVHLGAVAMWIGGLLLLLLTPDAPADGSSAWRFGDVAGTVSTVALMAVVLVVASGVAQSARFVGDYAAFTGTTYGRLVLLKWAGLVVLVGFGAYHRSRTMPALERDRDARGLRRTVRLETIVMLAIIMVAAWLARVSPPAGH